MFCRLLIGSVILVGVAAPVTAAEPLLAPEGGHLWSAFAGYGFAQKIGRSRDVDIASGGARWAYVWSRRGESAVRGHPGLAFELLPAMAFEQEPDTVHALGANALYEYHYAPRGRLLPVARLGVGYLQADGKVPPGETRHNFTVLAGFGLNIAAGGRTALSLEYRLHHVSNADTGDSNPGINAHTILVGFTIYPR